MDYRFLRMRFPGFLEKAVTLSYDDGNINDIKFSQIISEAGFKCTFNLSGNEFMNSPITDELAEEHYFKKGHEVAIHGLNHTPFGLLRVADGIREAYECKKELENRYGRIIRGMAYPSTGIRFFNNLTSYEKIKNYLTELDIVYARTLSGDNNGFDLPNDWHAWMPTAHHDNPELFSYIDEFLELDPPHFRTPRLFYIWGHTSEFESKNNWDRLDKICEKLGNKDFIWYATNIEIYNYVQAFNSLVFSADGKIIYNPTLIDVYINIDDKDYLIKSGETLKV